MAVGTKERCALLLTAVCLGAALLRLAATTAAVGEVISRETVCKPRTDYFVEGGEALIHGVDFPEVSWDLPASSVSNALLCRLPGRWAVLPRGLLLLPCAGLVFMLGWLLHSSLCGGLAALGFALSVSPSWLLEVEDRWPSVFLVLLAAYLAAWRARRPALPRTWALAGGLAANLAAISTVFLFGPLLALWERLTTARQRRTSWSALILCLAPLLILIPWLFMNWEVHHRLILFEKDRATNNIVTGVLGWPGPLPMGRAEALAGVSPGTNILAWAAGEVLRHPLRYLYGVLLRLRLVFSLQPLLVLAAALGLVWPRRRESARPVALLGLYFVVLHCLISVKAEYLDPVWPALLALATSLAAAALRLPEDEPAERLAGGVAALALGGALLWVSYPMALAAAYPARSARPDALDIQLARHPQDPWLWAERGSRRLVAGAAAAAASDFETAMGLDPQRDYEVRRAWALAASGRWDWSLGSPPPGATPVELRASILEILRRLKSGASAPARQAWKETEARLLDLQHRGADRDLNAADCDSLLQALGEVLGPWPARERARLINGLAGLAERGGSCLSTAQLAAPLDKRRKPAIIIR
jgi:hypothetical protein